MISKWRRAIIALLCFVLTYSLKAQPMINQITNGSFEDTTQCPFFPSQIDFAKGWFKPTLGGSSDYFNTCSNSFTNTIPSTSIITIPNNRFGFQYPRTGNAYQGLGIYSNKNPTDYREYIKNKLIKPITNTKTYCITFYVSFAEISRFTTSNLGYYFSNDSIVSGWAMPTLISITPDFEIGSHLSDTINWIQIQSTYTPSNSFRFFTIGNFRDDNNTNAIQVKPLINQIYNDMAYFYIDDVSVVEINPANAAFNDTLISRCVSDSVTLGTDSTEFASYTWSSTVAGMTALSCSNCPNPIAKPQVTTKYYLTKVQCSATTTDSVLVVVKTPTTIANAGTNQLICDGDIIQIGTPDSSVYTSYNWMPNIGLSCTNCATPFANPNTTTTYNLIRQECDLITSSSVQVSIDDCNPTYTVPNVFTPNYDDVNDTWGVKFSNTKYIKNFQMHIYDRWGLLVYSTNPDINTPNSKWDGHTSAGTECSAGVYFYVISFDKNEEHVELKGSVNLFR